MWSNQAKIEQFFHFEMSKKSFDGQMVKKLLLSLLLSNGLDGWKNLFSGFLLFCVFVENIFWNNNDKLMCLCCLNNQQSHTHRVNNRSKWSSFNEKSQKWIEINFFFCSVWIVNFHDHENHHQMWNWYFWHTRTIRKRQCFYCLVNGRSSSILKVMMMVCLWTNCLNVCDPNGQISQEHQKKITKYWHGNDEIW